MEHAAPATGTDTNKKVSLAALAEMTGFPIEMIEKELFLGKKNDEGVSLEELRAAMLTFIDATLINDEK